MRTARLQKDVEIPELPGTLRCASGIASPPLLDGSSSERGKCSPRAATIDAGTPASLASSTQRRARETNEKIDPLITDTPNLL
jgi:hypothetical protein